MKFDAYEYTGVILPGSVVVLAVALLFPEVKELLGKDGISPSAVWVCSSSLRSSLATSIQALGNTIEWLGDGVYGQGRSNSLLSPTQTLIAAAQRDRLEAILGQPGGCAPR